MKRLKSTLFTVIAYVLFFFSQAVWAKATPTSRPSFYARLPDWLRSDLWGVTVYQLLGVLLLIFVALLFRHIMSFFVSSALRKTLGRFHQAFDRSMELAAQPLSGLMMALVFFIGFPFLGFSSRVELVVAIAVRLVAVCSAVWLLYRQIDVFASLLAGKAEQTETRLDDQLVPLVRRTLKTFVVVIGGIFILQNLDVDVASLVAGLGLGGLAFALAAKDTVANLFGSLVIFIDRPFQIGDWICIENTHGTVEEVGFRTTKIRTFYNSLITVPNSKLTATMIDNYGARHYRRIKIMLGLTYSTTAEQMQAFVEGLRAIVAAHPLSRKDKYEIHFNNYGAYSLDVLFYVFVDAPSWSEELKARHEMFLSILELAKTLRVEFAFPTQTLHLDSMYQDRPRIVGDGPVPSNDELRKMIESVGPNGNEANHDYSLTHGFFPGFKFKNASSENEKR